MRVFVAGQQGAAEGGAHLARFAWWRAQNGGRGTFEELQAMDGEEDAEGESDTEDAARLADLDSAAGR